MNSRETDIAATIIAWILGAVILSVTFGLSFWQGVGLAVGVRFITAEAGR